MEADRVDKTVLDSLRITSAHFGAAMKLCNPSALRETHVSVFVTVLSSCRKDL